MANNLARWRDLSGFGEDREIRRHFSQMNACACGSRDPRVNALDFRLRIVGEVPTMRYGLFISHGRAFGLRNVAVSQHVLGVITSTRFAFTFIKFRVSSIAAARDKKAIIPTMLFPSLAGHVTRLARLSRRLSFGP